LQFVGPLFWIFEISHHFPLEENIISFFNWSPPEMGPRLKVVGAWVDNLIDLGNISVISDLRLHVIVLCDNVPLKVPLSLLQVVVIY
jgi:hypothetical protein